MLAVIYRRYLPHRRLVLKNPYGYAPLVSLFPIAREYDLTNGKPTAYVFQGDTCLAQMCRDQALAVLLNGFFTRQKSG